MIRAILLAMIRAYAALVSPVLGPGKCRFHPACSAYALQAIERHGAARGGFLALRRVLACQPYSRRPFLDPVPSSIKTPVHTTDSSKKA